MPEKLSEIAKLLDDNGLLEGRTVAIHCSADNTVTLFRSKKQSVRDQRVVFMGLMTFSCVQYMKTVYGSTALQEEMLILECAVRTMWLQEITARNIRIQEESKREESEKQEAPKAEN